MLTGSITALVTPFKNNKINYRKLEELIEFQIQNKTDGIVICGTTGENSTLSQNEKKKIVKFSVNTIRNRIPLIAGTGSNNSKESLNLSKYASDVGSDYVLLVSPYYNKTSQRGLISHYSYIADSVPIPCILYNVPSRTGLNISAKTSIFLSDHPNIVGLKEASGNMPQALEILANCSKDNFSVFSGNDDIIVPMLSIGSSGVISVLSNILPKEVHDMCFYYLNGNHEYSKILQLKYSNIISAIFSDVNPIPIKEAMNILEFDVGDPRLPLIKMEDTSILEKALINVPKYSNNI